MSFVILIQMYFPIILSLSSDDQQFHQYQENEQSHFSCCFCFNFFLYKNIVNMSVSSRLYYYNWMDTCPVGVIPPPESINHSSQFFYLDTICFKIYLCLRLILRSVCLRHKH